jgi:hypothetical protein
MPLPLSAAPTSPCIRRHDVQSHRPALPDDETQMMGYVFDRAAQHLEDCLVAAIADDPRPFPRLRRRRAEDAADLPARELDSIGHLLGLKDLPDEKQARDHLTDASALLVAENNPAVLRTRRVEPQEIRSCVKTTRPAVTP